jgi:PAS domain S-box-containing protein
LSGFRRVAAALRPRAAAFCGALGRVRTRLKAREETARFSLTRRLFLLTAIAFLPALVILIHYELDLRRAGEAEIRQMALRMARQTGAETDRIFEGVENLLSAVAHVPAVAEGEGAGCQAYLGALQRRLPHLLSVAVLDMGGRVACQAQGTRDGRRDPERYNARPWFRDVLDGKRFAVGAVSKAAGSEALVLPVAVPMLRQGEFRGAVVAGLDLAWLRERLKERGLVAGGEIAVTDRDGGLILREPPQGAAPGERIADEYQKLVNAAEPGILELVDEAGARRVLAYLPVPVAGGVYIAASLSRETAFAALDRATSRGLILMVAGLLIALGAAFTVGRVFIQRPVERLIDTVKGWRRGDERARTGMAPDEGEIEAVGAALDRLLDEVAARQKEAAEAARAEAESEERYRGLIELSPDAEFVDIDSRIVYVNAAMVRLLGASSAADLVGRSSLDLIAEEFRDAVRRRIASLRDTGGPNPPMEQRWLRLDGTPVEVEVVSARVPWEGGFANQVILRDIAARKAAEERQRFLLHELNHRVKNTLTTVQSLAAQTLRHAASPEDFSERFMARLLALSATQNLLTQGNWEHAHLSELLAAELKPHGDERVRIAGEDVLLPPRIVLPLGMVFHELATNAAKHGALSAPGGRVAVTWTVDERHCLRLEWREEGGPAVRPPASEGFGSRLLERTVSGELAGRYERLFRTDGLVCRLTIPLPSADPDALAERNAA